MLDGPTPALLSGVVGTTSRATRWSPGSDSVSTRGLARIVVVAGSPNMPLVASPVLVLYTYTGPTFRLATLVVSTNDRERSASAAARAVASMVPCAAKSRKARYTFVFAASPRLNRSKEAGSSKPAKPDGSENGNGSPDPACNCASAVSSSATRYRSASALQ